MSSTTGFTSEYGTALRTDAHGKIVLTNPMDVEVDDATMQQIYALYINAVMKGENHDD